MSRRLAGLLLTGLMLVACGGPRREAGEKPSDGEAPAVAGTPRALDPPAEAGAFAPRLAAGDGELLLTWWQPVAGADGKVGHRLMFSRFVDAWSAPTVVIEERDFFANWADFPAVLREPSGSLLVSWLEKTADATFAYSIELARSNDDGATWTPLGRLNDDETDTEHGFVSLVPEGAGVRAYWLDGRLMVDGGPMTVRSASIGESVGSSELLDDRVCECCPTDAVATAEGSVVVYRDRADDETREIYAVRRDDGGWSEPQPVTADRWRIPGCPVNGPSVDHRDGSTVVAWFTAREGAPRVSVRFGLEPSDGASEVLVDGQVPLGRVGVVLDHDGTALVSWLAVVDDEAELRLRRVARDGSLGEPLALGRTSGSRASGVPQLVRLEDDLYAAWVEVLGDAESRIRVHRVPPALVPAI